MAMEQGKKHLTYADYAGWDDSVRYELIEGMAYMMTAPSWIHQSISMSLATQIHNFLHGKPCKVFAAPFDVRLNADGNDDTVVQPDLVVICDRSKLSGSGCLGAPDMVVEILSPSNARYDILVKFQQYQKAGVREYWIVDPERRVLSVHVMENGKYFSNTYGDTDIVPVHILEGCQITMQDVFEAVEEDKKE
ncbi:MAG: Uma2 family endonuclease [Peptococcaceae bacterium]|nr:Uma2 family endonuclease [Peptococcaceae bacterium]